MHWLTLGISFSWAYSFAFWLFFVFQGCSVYFLGKVAFNRVVGLGAAILYLIDRGATSSGGWFWTVDVGTWPIALSIAFSTMATAFLARALEDGQRRDAVWCGVCIGLALLTHPLQLVYVPTLCGAAFGLAILVVPWTRLRAHAVSAAAAAGCGVLVGAGWYVPFVAYSDYSRAYGWQWASLDEIGANIYQGTLFPAGATLLSGEAIKSDVMAYVPATADGLSLYITVLSILVLPILFLSKRLLPLLLSTLTLVLLIGASSTVHDALGMPTWWASYKHMEFARFVMLVKPFMCVAAAVGAWGLWKGVSASISKIGAPAPASRWNLWARALIAAGLMLGPTIPAAIVVLNRHVFLATPTKSLDPTNGDRAQLVEWIRSQFAADPRFFRVAARGADVNDHSLTDLGAELPVPMLHLGFTPAMPFRYTMGSSAVFLPTPSDSNATFKALNVRYVISKVPVDRADCRFARQFGTLGLYEFTDWTANPCDQRRSGHRGTDAFRASRDRVALGTGFSWQAAPERFVFPALVRPEGRTADSHRRVVDRRGNRLHDGRFVAGDLSVPVCLGPGGMAGAAAGAARHGRPRRPRVRGRELRRFVMIRKLTSGEYRLYSRKRDAKTGKRKNLGTFKSRAAAERHERQVQFFKRR